MTYRATRSAPHSGPVIYFGEIALIDDGTRTASVTAETRHDAATAMTFWEFRPIVETDARIAWKLVQGACAQAARARGPLIQT